MAKILSKKIVYYLTNMKEIFIKMQIFHSGFDK